VETAFRLANTGTEKILVDKPSTSCACTLSGLTKTTELPPGEALNLKIVAKAPASPSMRYTVFLTFYEKGSGQSRHVSLELLGTCRIPMSITPDRLDFGRVVAGTSSCRTIRLVELPTDRFVVKEVDPGKLPIRHEIVDVTNGNGLHSYQLRVTLSPKKGESRGGHEGALLVTLEGITRKEIRIPVRYVVAPPVSLLPGAVAFGTVTPGQLCTQSLSVVTLDHAERTVVECRAPEGCSVEVDNAVHPPKLTVKARVPKPGVWHGVLRVKVRGSGADDEWIEATCAAYGRAGG
jgi:hypothetical protein